MLMTKLTLTLTTLLDLYQAFTKYLGALHHEKKIKQTVTWLLQEFDIRSNVILQDPKIIYS